MKSRFFYIVLFFVSCKCCSVSDYVDILSKLVSEYKKQKSEKDISDVKNIVKEVVENAGIGEFCGEELTLHRIDCEKIKNIVGLEGSVDLDKMKEQASFIENIAKIYRFEFLLRLIKNKGEKATNFMITVNGVGGPVLYTSGYIARKISFGRSKNSLILNDVNGKMERYTDIPIYDRDNGKLFCRGNNVLKMYNKLNIGFEDIKMCSDYIFFCSVCEYLAQLGNPLFGICDGFESDVAEVFNAVTVAENLFLDRVEKVEMIDVFKKNKNKNIKLKSDREILGKIKSLGACKEKDLILISEVIALNNLLFDVFSDCRSFKKSIVCDIIFSSYGGRVWEMLGAILKNGYRNFDGGVDYKKKTYVKKGEISCTFINGLLGSNKLKKDSNVNIEKVFKDVGAEWVSADRLKYFDCDTILGNRFDDIIRFWNDKVYKDRDNFIVQIISNFVDSEDSNLLKKIVRWDFNKVVGSLYRSRFNDCILSDEGLFVYDKNFEGGEVRKIIGDNIKKPFECGDFNYFSFKDKNVKRGKIESNFLNIDGAFLIEDMDLKILYIHMGRGGHCNDYGVKSSNDVFEGRGSFLYDILRKYRRNK